MVVCHTGRFAGSYVTGSHTFKAGVQIKRYNLGREGANTNPDAIPGGLSYIFRNQVPIQVQLWAVPFELLEYTMNTDEIGNKNPRLRTSFDSVFGEVFAMKIAERTKTVDTVTSDTTSIPKPFFR